MDLKEARRRLSGKLVFGDAAQIEAVKFMELVHDCLEAYNACDERHNDYSNRWSVEKGALKQYCDCVHTFSAEVRPAAAQIWKGL